MHVFQCDPVWLFGSYDEDIGDKLRSIKRLQEINCMRWGCAKGRDESPLKVRQKICFQTFHKTDIKDQLKVTN